VPDARWLDERETRAWRGYLAMRRALERGVDRQLTQESGLSSADYQLLVPLSEAPECGLRARDLGRGVDWERSRLSHQIRRMEQRGLIARKECPTDARGTLIVLTPAGRSAIEAAAPAHVRWVRANFIDLLTSEELEALGSISERVVDRLNEVGDVECGSEASNCD
jgi:DNA-binding MarR family transcriptional regulator